MDIWLIISILVLVVGCAWICNVMIAERIADLMEASEDFFSNSDD